MRLHNAVSYADRTAHHGMGGFIERMSAVFKIH